MNNWNEVGSNCVAIAPNEDAANQLANAWAEAGHDNIIVEVEKSERIVCGNDIRVYEVWISNKEIPG
jgi:hypothetical protein